MPCAALSPCRIGAIAPDRSRQPQRSISRSARHCLPGSRSSSIARSMMPSRRSTSCRRPHHLRRLLIVLSQRRRTARRPRESRPTRARSWHRPSACPVQRQSPPRRWPAQGHRPSSVRPLPAVVLALAERVMVVVAVMAAAELARMRTCWADIADGSRASCCDHLRPTMAMRIWC